MLHFVEKICGGKILFLHSFSNTHPMNPIYKYTVRVKESSVFGTTTLKAKSKGSAEMIAQTALESHIEEIEVI